MPGSESAAVQRGSASAQEKAWEHFQHGADIGVRGFGPDVPTAFENAAIALTAAITEAAIELRNEVAVQCEAPDLELLLVDWLNTVIYEMSVRQMLFGHFRVAIDGTRLRGTLRGEPVDVGRHSPACEPKGATYTALKVGQDESGTWSASCVVDV